MQQRAFMVRALCWACVSAAMSAGCGGGFGALPRGLRPEQLNVVVITLDTTRADRLGCYGATSVATPRIDGLAREGVKFENAVSSTPLTLPAHSSLFTARFPAAHGVRDNGGFKLAPDQLTLAEVLSQHGWVAGGFVSAYVLDHRWGIAQGFQTYHDGFDLMAEKKADMGDIQRRGDETVTAALDWLAQHKAEKTFTWVHLYDPHAPYDPPEPYASRYAGRDYDGEIAWTDELVGRMLDGLQRLGLRDRTVIALLADHGESLGEHDEHGHGLFIYRQTTHIPLIIAAPQRGLSGVRVAATARIVDVAPTLLELVGLPGALEGQGQSLLPLIAGTTSGDPRSGYAESFYGRFHYGWSELRSVENGRWRLIEAPKPELYDHSNDPQELTNLAAQQVSVLHEMRERLAALDAETPAASAAVPVEEDEETLSRLASLGYVGTVSAPIDASFRELPDPKDRIEVYNLMNHARELLKEEKDEQARVLFEQVLQLDHKTIDAWYLIGNTYYKARRWREAGEYYRKTLALRADHDYAMIGLADTLTAEGKLDDAVLGYERFLKSDPNNAQITYRLAQVLLDAGRNADAARWFDTTLQLERGTARAEVGKSVVAFRAKDYAAAAAALQRALTLDPKAKHARYNLALLHEESGRPRDAIEAYRAALLDDPKDYKAAFNLGRLLQQLGDREGSMLALRQACEVNPRFGTGRFFLAGALLEQGTLDEAERWAREGLAVDPHGQFSALGEYVLADVFSRKRQTGESAAALARGQRLEADAKRRRFDQEELLP
ncbi:MAG: sulfatase-like hydrolase/transferase [Acidobacteriota bacterium]